MNVIPKLSVGIGTTTPISVNYNSEYAKLLINPITFAASDVEANRIDINNNGFKTGDKVSIIESKPFSKNKKFQVMENTK